MKKILYSLIAVLAMVMSSCSNDDIEVIKTGGVAFNVSSQGVYDDFGISDDFKNNYLSGSYYIGIYTFVYNSDGSLAVSDSLYTKTFGNVEQRFDNLKYGEYTVVSVEMLVDEDDSYQSAAWRIIGKEKLSTLEIVHKDFIDKSKKEEDKSYVAEWQMAVGCATCNFVIDRKDEYVLNLIPKGLGAIINTYMTNFSQSNFKALFFYTKNQPVGRYLNPNLVGDDRFHYDKYTEERVWTHRGGAWYDYIPDPFKPRVYLLEAGNVLCCFGAHIENADGTLNPGFNSCPNDNTKYLVEDGKTYFAGFHYLGGENEDCIGDIFCEYSQYLKWYSSLPTSIIPKLYQTWGASVRDVQKYMNNYEMVLGEEGVASLQDDGNYAISFIGRNQENSIYYVFTSQTSGLFEIMINYPNNNSNFTQILDYLNSNYELLVNSEDIYMFVSSDEKTGVVLSPVEDSLVLVFIDMNSSTSTQIKSNPKAFLKTYVRK